MTTLNFNGQKINIEAALRDLDRADCEDSLYMFLLRAIRLLCRGKRGRSRSRNRDRCNGRLQHIQHLHQAFWRAIIAGQNADIVLGGIIGGPCSSAMRGDAAVQTDFDGEHSVVEFGFPVHGGGRIRRR